MVVTPAVASRKWSHFQNYKNLRQCNLVGLDQGCLKRSLWLDSNGWVRYGQDEKNMVELLLPFLTLTILHL